LLAAVIVSRESVFRKRCAMLNYDERPQIILYFTQQTSRYASYVAEIIQPRPPLDDLPICAIIVPLCDILFAAN